MCPQELNIVVKWNGSSKINVVHPLATAIANAKVGIPANLLSSIFGAYSQSWMQTTENKNIGTVNLIIHYLVHNINPFFLRKNVPMSAVYTSPFQWVQL